MGGLEPKVAIVIANHNYGRYLDRAISSVLNQDYPKDRLSVFIVDDGSTDNSLEVLEKYFDDVYDESGVPSVGVREGVNLYLLMNDTPVGPSEARNKAISWMLENAPADIIGILDSDDEMLPGKTKVLARELNNIVGVAYADYITVDETGFERIEFKEPFCRDKLYRECIIHSGSFISADALRQVKRVDGYYYDPVMRTCEDYDLWIRISKDRMINHVPIPLTKVLTHSQNSTNTVDMRVWEQNWQRIWNKLTASR